MEFIAGETLARWARRHRSKIDAGEVVRLGRCVASALDAIHKAGVLHRDVKTDNVMVTTSLAGDTVSVKLMDFGLAVGGDTSRMTRVGAVLGTVGYMSPEQASGKELSPKADLYSLGVVLFELCCDRLPYEASEPAATLHAIVHDPVPSVLARCPAVPSELAVLIEELLAKEPNKRPASAAEVVRRLEALATDSSFAPSLMLDPVSPMRSSSHDDTSNIMSRTLVELKSETAWPFGSSASSSVEAVSVVSQSWIVSLHLVSAAVARGIERDELLRECLGHAIDGLDGTSGVVALTRDNGTIEYPATRDLDPADVQELLTLTIREEIGFVRTPGREGPESCPAVCAPVWAGERVLGAVLVERDTHPFDGQALEFLASIGYLIGLAVERERLLTEILNSERLAAVGNMLAGVAHDFKNPLTVIRGFAEISAMTEDRTVRAESHEHIIKNVDIMNEMVVDLLAFVRGDRRLNATWVDVPALAGEIEGRLRLRCERRNIALNVKSSPGELRLDGGRTKRIIINLAENAIAALKAGSRIDVSLMVEDRRIVIRVADDGPGIPDEVRERMFQPFISGGSAGSTGLGLAIVRRFVEDHGGSIEVESGEGRGTSFVIALPELGS
jgi:signal transduction histidine kinase